MNTPQIFNFEQHEVRWHACIDENIAYERIDEVSLLYCEPTWINKANFNDSIAIVAVIHRLQSLDIHFFIDSCHYLVAFESS